MAGSVAEERIRTKAETALRARYPAARIVHELKLGYWRHGPEVRIDMAAVMTSRFVLVELKSERDTLKRLGAQIERAAELTDEVWLVCHDRLWPGVEAAGHSLQMYLDGHLRADLHAEVKPWVGKVEPLKGWRYQAVMYRAEHYSENATTESLVSRTRGGYRSPFALNPVELLRMLWADELRSIASAHGVALKPRCPILPAIAALSDALTGAEVRRAACWALRRRPFARGDAPVIESLTVRGLNSSDMEAPQ